MDRGSGVGAGTLPVLGCDHYHLVTHAVQHVYSGPQAGHDTVRGGKEGLGEERDAQAVVAPSLPTTARSSTRCHDGNPAELHIDKA